MSTNKPTPDGTGGFPEVRLKAGYKNPASPNAPADTASSVIIILKYFFKCYINAKH